MMKGRDRRNLKSLAKVRSIDLKIGKKGLTSNFLEEARKILLRDGMIKMSHTLLKNERHDVISKIELLLSVQLIEKVGKTLTFHKYHIMKVKPLNEGEKIPQFSTKDEDGVIHSNQTIKGQLTLIYFYPRDNTPGCTTQACDIRDSYDELLKVPVHILALSTCSLISHQKFKSKFSLPFPDIIG